MPDPDNDSDVDSGDDEGGGSEGGSNASSSAEDSQNDEVPEVQDEDQEGGAGDDDAAPALANGAADTVAVALEEALPAVFLDQGKHDRGRDDECTGLASRVTGADVRCPQTGLPD